MNEYRRHLNESLERATTSIESYREELNGLDRNNPDNDDRIEELERLISNTEPAVERLTEIQNAYNRISQIENSATSHRYNENGERIPVLSEELQEEYNNLTSTINTWEDSIRDVVNNERRQAPQEPVEPVAEPVAEPIAEEPENNDNFEIPVLQDINYSELINNLDNSIAFTERRRTSLQKELDSLEEKLNNPDDNSITPDNIDSERERLNIAIEGQDAARRTLLLVRRATTNSNEAQERLNNLNAELSGLPSDSTEDKDRINRDIEIQNTIINGHEPLIAVYQSFTASQDAIDKLDAEIDAIESGTIIGSEAELANLKKQREEAVARRSKAEKLLEHYRERERVTKELKDLEKNVKYYEENPDQIKKNGDKKRDGRPTKEEFEALRIKLNNLRADYNRHNNSIEEFEKDYFERKKAIQKPHNDSIVPPSNDDSIVPPSNDDTPPTRTQDPVQTRRGYREIINDLMQGLTNIRANDGRKYRAANIKVGAAFANEIRNGNWLYNVVSIVPAIVKAPIRLISKLISKITYRKKSKQEAKILKERIANLSSEDLDTLVNEYTTNRRHEYGARNTLLQVLLDERIREHLRDKRAKLNDVAAGQYVEIFKNASSINAINTELASPDITEERRTQLLEQKSRILDGKCGLIKSFIKNRENADRLLNDGEHGYSEGTRSIFSRLNRLGLRFTKGEESPELREQLAALEHQMNQALDSNNPEAALLAFADLEAVVAQNTTTRRTLFGVIEDGPTSHRPLAQDVDFRDDMFVRNLLTTITVSAGVYSVVNGIRVSAIDAKNRAEVARANQEYAQSMDTVHQTGQQLYEHAEKFNDGQIQMSEQGILSYGTGLERRSLDLSNWNFDAAYHANDAQAHVLYNNLYDATYLAQQTVMQKLNSGAISHADALQQLTAINNNVQSTLQQFTTTYGPELAQYAATHPQFDLHSLENAVTEIAQNPNAIQDMSSAMVESVQLGDMLQNLPAAQIANLEQLPDTILGPLVTTIAASALATQGSRAADKQHNKNGSQQLTDMVMEYAESRPQLQQPAEPAPSRRGR